MYNILGGLMMKLVFPNIRYKEKAIDFIKEMREHGSEINGTGGLDRFLTESDYESWLRQCDLLYRYYQC